MSSYAANQRSLSNKERKMTRRIACLATVLGLCAVAVPAAASAASRTQRQPAEPAITVPAGAVKSAMACKGNAARARRGAILLIPGTFATAEVNWSWNWQKLLPKLGYASCMITLPEVGAGDIQR